MGLGKLPLSEDKLTPKLRHQMGRFDCGDEPWQREISDALISGELLRDQLYERVCWLYLNDEQTLVGYGGLAVSEIEWLPELRLSKRYLEVNPIGVDKRFFGSKDTPREDRCSYMIMGDLIIEARARNVAPFLILYVHPKNARAIAFYRNVGFREMFEIDRLNPRNNTRYPCMTLRL